LAKSRGWKVVHSRNPRGILGAGAVAIINVLPHAERAHSRGACSQVTVGGRESPRGNASPSPTPIAAPPTSPSAATPKQPHDEQQ